MPDMHTRKRTGCWSCRTRRKKCDEIKPTCEACKRNCLVCNWPTATDTAIPRNKRCVEIDPWKRARRIQQLSQTSKRRHCSKSEVIQSPGSNHRALATLAPLRDTFSEGWEANLLLQYYLAHTSQHITIRPGPENAFLSHVLPLAATHEVVMAAVLSLSACELQQRHSRSATDDAPFRIRYVAAIQAVRKEIDSQNLVQSSQTLPLLMASLLLCLVEAMSGDTTGAFFHHIRAAQRFLELHLTSSEFDSSDTFVFALEIYLYLSTISHITPGVLTDIRTVGYDDYMFNLIAPCSIHNFSLLLPEAQPLFKAIPQVSRLARQCFQDKSANLPTIQRIFGEICSSGPSSGVVDPNRPTKAVAVIYQQALVMYLLYLLYSDDLENPVYVNGIELATSTFWQSLRAIPWDSTVHTVLMWPVLTIGSFLICSADKDSLLQLLGNQSIRFHVILPCVVSKVLRLLWSTPGLYGPLGLERIMVEHRINIGVA